MAAEKYTGGTVVHVIDRDDEGVPTQHVERDTDGQHWHVVDGVAAPISGAEAKQLEAESEEQ